MNNNYADDLVQHDLIQHSRRQGGLIVRLEQRIEQLENGLRGNYTEQSQWIETLKTALAEAQHRIKRLETALAAVVRALAYGDTTYPNVFPPHQHGLCGAETAQHLVTAAEALDIDVDLELDEEEG